MASTIQILLFGDVGDAVLTMPALHAVRSHFPDSRIQVLCKPAIGSFLSDSGLVDEVIAVEKTAFDSPLSLFDPRRLAALLALWLRLRSSRPDMVIVFHHLVRRWGGLKCAALALAGGAGRRVGLDNGRGWFLTDRVPDRGFGAVHESEYWRQVAAAVGADTRQGWRLPVKRRDAQRIEDLLRELKVDGTELVALHPGTGAYGPGRRWAAESFATAAGIIAGSSDVHFVVVGTDIDKEAAAQVCKVLGSRATDLTGRTRLGELAALLARCRLSIANDGGVGHISAAVGTPVVSIFGPSNDLAWRPLLGTVVRANLPCRPCFYRDFQTGNRFGCRTRECLTWIRPQDVASAALRILGDARVA
ncbi:MAG TPA: glycosyltransferase family 9 protein [Chloroflexota bacterium]|nr:glycosyltransferase family 9 protein [Chloroflexota bacterium]